MVCIALIVYDVHVRYLVWFDLFLNNIDKSHPGAKELLQKGGIAVARSLIPGALSAVDKTMEETFMKFAKSAGRINIGHPRLVGSTLQTAGNLCLSRWIFWTVLDVRCLPTMV